MHLSVSFFGFSSTLLGLVDFLLLLPRVSICHELRRKGEENHGMFPERVFKARVQFAILKMEGP